MIDFHNVEGLLTSPASLGGLHPSNCPFTIFASAELTETGQNEHDRGGSASWRGCQIGRLYARALSPSCDMPRYSWAVGSQDLILVYGFNRPPVANGHSIENPSGASGNKRIGNGGAAKLTRMQALMVDLSTQQPGQSC